MIHKEEPSRTLALFPTYQCNAACTNCGTYSSPQDQNRLEPRVMMDAIDEAASLGFKLVVLTGGEATLHWDTCIKAIRHASQVGLATRLVSNGHWAKNLNQAQNAISQLKDAGLRELNLSTGDEHARFIPVECVAYAAHASIVAGIETLIMIEIRGHRVVTKDQIVTLLDPKISTSLKFIESPWIPMDQPFGCKVEGAIDRSNIGAAKGCDSVLSTYVVAADGRIGACCGLGMRSIPELQVGHISDATPLASAIATAETDFLKIWLAAWGPHRILAWAAQFDPTIDWEGKFVHRCHACISMYKDPRVRAVLEEKGTGAVLPVAIEVATKSYVEEELISLRIFGGDL